MAAHRYWRLYVSVGNHASVVAVGSMELRTDLAGTGTNYSLNGNGGVASASSEGTGPAAGAFDGNSTSSWIGLTIPSWVKWDLGAGASQDIVHLTLRNTGNADSGYAPKTAQLEWSDDNTSWTPKLYVNNGSSDYGAVSTFTEPNHLDATLMGPAPVVSGATGAASALLSPGVTAQGFFGGVASMNCPVVAGGYSGGNAGIALRPTTVAAYGHDSSGENGAGIAAPTSYVSSFGGGNGKTAMSPPTGGITATFTVFGTAALNAPRAVVATSGTTSGTAQAALKLSLPGIVGYSGAVCSITLNDSPVVSASSTTGSAGNAALILPLFDLAASGTAQSYGGASLLSPSAQLGATAQAWIMAPMAKLTAIGTAVVVASYEAYAINLNHKPGGQEAPADETTRYTNFPFTQIVRYQNSYFGVAADGLYLLEGPTDAGVDIEFSVKTAATDFKSPMQKTVASAYLAGRIGAGMTTTLYVGQDSQLAYGYDSGNGVQARTFRQKFGKGIRPNQYYALGISGIGELEVDTVELETHDMKRRI